MSQTTAGKYHTKHYEELLTYLRTIPGEHVTVGDLAAAFQDRGSKIGTATIYRNLERMVSEGLVSKYIVNPRTPACFSFIGDSPEVKPAECGGYHCLCESCGRLIHISCHEIESLQHHLMQDHRFRVNPHRTVFYGLCEDCSADDLPEDTDHAAGPCGCHHENH